MNGPDLSLNLARKWRSARFDQIIGQDLAVRMLKNSLYLNHFFPVYLFSGQRGCGKTTTARVFAAALNCEKLPVFQQQPQEQLLPCGECYSCRCMQQGKHPDFIEMDAASNTGVDHVRNIIDACTLLPVLGNKKIYLIDEAHMLSKAAFNAFLKVMEEPPQSVIFLLATTDEHKIIETVRSRCFTLVFPAIATPVLVQHLAHICQAEDIAYEQEALHIIARHVGGSARDALNLLEQVRFAHASITTESVLTVAGYIADEQLLQLIKLLCTASDAQVIVQWIAHHGIAAYQPETIYKRLMQLLHHAVWEILGGRQVLQESLDFQETIGEIPVIRLTLLFGLFAEHEQNLLRTSNRHAYLQMILLMMWQRLQQPEQPVVAPPSRSPVAPAARPVSTPMPSRTVSSTSGQQPVSMPKAVAQPVHVPVSEVVVEGPAGELWQQLIAALNPADEPLLYSMVMQARPVTWQDKKLTVALPGHLSLFEDMILQAPAMKRALVRYDAQATLVVQWDAIENSAKPRITQQSRVIHPSAHGQQEPRKQQVAATHRTPLRNIDPQQWPITTVLLEELSGTVTEIEEGQ